MNTGPDFTFSMNTVHHLAVAMNVVSNFAISWILVFLFIFVALFIWALPFEEVQNQSEQTIDSADGHGNKDRDNKRHGRRE